jgi:nicotinamidase-related amidase
MAANSGFLVVIDMQTVFADVASPWYPPSFADAAARVEELLPLFGQRVVFTRFVPPSVIEESWAAYYRKWEFAKDTPADRIWSLASPWTGRTSVDSHRFSKWVLALRRITGRHPMLTLCGVSTDRCVLGTALAAIDAGAHVRVVTDACTARTPAIQQRVLSLLHARAPMLELTTVRQERARHLSGQATSDNA